MRPHQQERSQVPRQPPRYKDDGVDAVENSEDGAKILADQDETGLSDERAAAEESSENSTTLFELEPAEFARGEVDVKEQMDRTTRDVDDALNHTGTHDPELEET